jgi:hypothetical protein
MKNGFFVTADGRLVLHGVATLVTGSSSLAQVFVAIAARAAWDKSRSPRRANPLHCSSNAEQRKGTRSDAQKDEAYPREFMENRIMYATHQDSLLIFLRLPLQPRADFFFPALGEFAQAFSIEVNAFAGGVAKLAFQGVAVGAFERDLVAPE